MSPQGNCNPGLITDDLRQADHGALARLRLVRRDEYRSHVHAGLGKQLVISARFTVCERFWMPSKTETERAAEARIACAVV